LLPDTEAGEAAGLSLSVAAAVEEPDLRRGADLVHEWGGMADTGHVSLSGFSDAGRMVSGGEQAIIIAVVNSDDGVRVGVYCRFPVALIPDLTPRTGPVAEYADSLPQAATAYADVMRRSGCLPDALVVAVGGCEFEGVAALAEFGRPVAQHVSAGEGVVTLREVTDKKQRERLDKLFIPGWLGTAKATMVLEGPFAHCAARARAGDTHVFACLIPVGTGMAGLQQRELLIEKLAGRLDGFSGGVVWVPEADDEDVSGIASGDEASVEGAGRYSRLPGVKNILRHYHDGTRRGMDYAREDWEEDQRIESAVADSCGMLVRGLDEYLVAVGAQTHNSMAIAQLYPASALVCNAIRRSLAAPGGAVSAFTRGAGHIALWPYHFGVDEATTRIMARRPAVGTRRALVGHDVPVRGGVVVMLGR